MRSFLAVLVSGLAVVLAMAQTPKPAPKPVIVELAMGQQFYYAGDPFFVRLSIRNDGESEVKNPIKGALLKSFVVSTADGTPLRPSGEPDVPEPARPERLTPRGFYGTVVDIAKIFPQLRSPGAFQIRWSADGLESDVVQVRIVPKYDPSKSYVARVETEEGTFVIDFLKGTAPIAVKAFVDLANVGFYDGLTLHEVRSDWLVAGGDPRGDGSGEAPFRYPAEMASVPVVTGTVLMKPVATSPPSNSSQFVIMLRPQPEWTGQFTVVGQITEGLEIIKKISSLPSTQQTAKPFYKPIKDVHTLKVSILEKSAQNTAPPPAKIP